MCIAILNQNKDNIITENQLSNSWDNNNQGAGLLYFEDGEMKIFKTFDKKELIQEYFKVREFINGSISLHFRISTSGKHNFENLHPFKVNDNLGFVHNGVLWGLGDSVHSDTYQFNEMLKEIKGVDIGLISTPLIADMLDYYTEGSKLIFMSREHSYIVNEQDGKWEDGNWYSNDSHKRVNNFVYAGNRKVYKPSGLHDSWLREEELEGMLPQCFECLYAGTDVTLRKHFGYEMCDECYNFETEIAIDKYYKEDFLPF